MFPVLPAKWLEMEIIEPTGRKSKTAEIESQLLHLRKELKSHALYKNLNSIKDLQIFMEAHVFAVWDFMSLLKSLQQHLTTTSTPWTPPLHSDLARFINEIVLDEESDIDVNGNTKSHFEMYLDSMEQIGADTTQIKKFLSRINSGMDVLEALKETDIDSGVKNFVANTFSVIDTNEPHLIASAFTFGREDIIPDMFIEILNTSDPTNNKYNKFRYYLQRHIELDGDEHGPLALRLISELCGGNEEKWNETTNVAKQSLTKRIKLWDAAKNAIIESASNENLSPVTI